MKTTVYNNYGEDTSSKIIVRSTGIVMAITVLHKIFGFVEKQIIAFFWGTGIEADAYLMVYSIIYMVYIIIKEVVASSFLPVFIGYLKNEEDEKKGWEIASIIGNILTILFTIIVVACMLASPFVISVFAPGYKGEQRELTIKLFRIASPALLFMSISALAYPILNSYKKFALPVFGDAIFKASPTIIFLSMMKVAGFSIGLVAGTLGQLSLYIFGIRKKIKFYKPSLNISCSPFQKVMRLSGPLFLCVLFWQLTYLVSNIFASTLPPGSVSALTYAQRLIEMPIYVVPLSMGVVVFPFFSETSQAGEKHKLKEMFFNSLRTVSLIFVPLAAGCMILSVPIIKLLFERGEFTPVSTVLTASVLRYIAFGMVAWALEIILHKFYFSQFDVKTPMIISGLGLLLYVALAFPFMKYLSLKGIALAWSLSQGIKVCLLFVLLKKKIEDINLLGSFSFIGQIGLSTLIMVLSVYIITHLLGNFLDLSKMFFQAAHLLCSVGIGALIFFVMMSLMRMQEAGIVWNYLRLNFKK